MSHSTQEPRLTPSPRFARRLRSCRAAGIAAAACGAAAALGWLSTASSGAAGATGQIPLSAHQTIVWAIQGGVSNAVGSEGQASKHEVAGFEKAHPNIKVQVIPLSEDADTARSSINNYFLAGSSTPDVMDASTSWVGAMANAHFIYPLDSWSLGPFLPGAVKETSFQGKLYAALWYFNAEGLYYRKDLVKTAPKTPMQLVADAQAAMKRDPKLKEGLAIEGSKYEGFVTVFVDLLRAFGGNFDPAHFDTPQNLKALTFLHDLVYKYKIVPTAVAGWQETQTDNAFQSGQSAFETNWPYVQQEDFAKSSSFKLSGKGDVGFAPFPSVNGHGVAMISSDALIVNAKSKHLAADEALLKYVMSPGTQQARAITSGDPPSVRTAYNSVLFRKAPYFRSDLNVFKVGYPDLVSAHYPQISADIQSMLSSVLANQQSPAAALKSTAGQLASIGS